MNPYETLCVSDDATEGQIKDAFRKLSKAHHPDTGDGDTKRFDEVQRAYAILSDPERRARYDETGDTGEDGGVEAAKIGNTLCQYFAQALATTAGGHQHTDLILKSRHLMMMAVTDQKRVITRHRQRVSNGLDILRRVKFNGKGRDMLSESLNAAVQADKAAITNAEEQIRILNKAAALADQYAFQTDSTESPFDDDLRKEALRLQHHGGSFLGKMFR